MTIVALAASAAYAAVLAVTLWALRRRDRLNVPDADADAASDAAGARNGAAGAK